MQPADATVALALWDDGNGISVNYSTEVVQNLRRIAVDGFNAFSRGGKEIGGVLYGKRRESGLAVLAYAELECEHALGPRFLLSENDHAAMAGLMEPRDGFEAIGWFRAHTRSGLELDEKDRELFDRHFDHPLSVGLVLKPTRWGPATAAFYVRDSCGQVGPESVREFAIELPTREMAETIPSAAEAPPVVLALERVAPVVAEPAVAVAPLANPGARKAISQPRRSWPWAMCGGVLLGVIITLALESHPSRQAHANTPPQPSPAGDVRATTAPDRAQPVLAASPTPQPVIATPAFQPPISKEVSKPKQREAHIPQVVPSAPAPPASLPAPPPASFDLAVAPKSLDIPLNPLLAVAPPPTVTPRSASAYTGPRQGRLIWAGDLGRRGVFEMDGSRVNLGSLTGVLPHVPLTLRIMPAELTRDGLTVFTAEPLRDNKTEPPSQSNGWNSLRFKLDAARAHELVLLETPNAANDYARFAVRNDGRPCFVVLLEWKVE